MIVDCGFAVRSKKTLRCRCGSLPFAAPEILDDPCRYHGGPADAFALGMLLFELVRGQSAMGNELGWTCHTKPSPARARQLRMLLINGPPTINRNKNEPTEVYKLLRGLLQVDPSERTRLVEVLQSSWLSMTPSSIRMSASQSWWQSCLKFCKESLSLLSETSFPLQYSVFSYGRLYGCYHSGLLVVSKRVKTCINK
jgi:serine/threonine protein kinase